MQDDSPRACEFAGAGPAGRGHSSMRDTAGRGRGAPIGELIMLRTGSTDEADPTARQALRAGEGAEDKVERDGPSAVDHQPGLMTQPREEPCQRAQPVDPRRLPPMAGDYGLPGPRCTGP